MATRVETTPQEEAIRQRFGAALFRERTARDIPQGDLAAMVGMSQQWLWKVEHGEQPIALEKAQGLADALGIPLARLMRPVPTPEEAKRFLAEGRKAKKAAAAALAELDALIAKKRTELDELDDKRRRQIAHGLYADQWVEQLEELIALTERKASRGKR